MKKILHAALSLLAGVLTIGASADVSENGVPARRQPVFE